LDHIAIIPHEDVQFASLGVHVNSDCSLWLKKNSSRELKKSLEIAHAADVKVVRERPDAGSPVSCREAIAVAGS